MRWLIFLVASAAFVSGKSYFGSKLVRVNLNSEHEVELFRSLQTDYNELDFWKDPAVNRPVDVNVPQHLMTMFANTCAREGIAYEVLQENLESLINTNSASVPRLERLSKIATSLKSGAPVSRAAVFYDIVNTFPRYSAVVDWLETMASTSSHAEVYDIGRTYEGRSMKVIKITANGDFGRKPVIWLDSAIHAREWLTVGTTVWIINQLLSKYGVQADVTRMMDEYEWHILPVSNPDGYEYTHTSDRLWRKTRTPTPSRRCKGVDPNRNWDYKFGYAGTSSDPCSDTYKGETAFSENCVVNMKNAISAVSGRMSLYMGVHSYSQLLLTPWAYGSDVPVDRRQLDAVAEAGVDAIQSTYGKRFVYGAPPDILYAAAGGAYDWVKAVKGVQYSYTYELRPDGYSYNGFVVAESEIPKSGLEIWNSLVAMIEAIKTQ
jgi:hypothetical protein